MRKQYRLNTLRIALINKDLCGAMTCEIETAQDQCLKAFYV